MNKYIAIMDKPKNCEKCVFGRCAYSLPLSTRRKGYCCYLLPPERQMIHDFDYDAEVHIPKCPLKAIPERKPFVGVDAINAPFLDGRIDEALHEAAWLGWNACLDEIEK